MRHSELSKLGAIDTSGLTREFAYGVYQQNRQRNTVSSSLARYGVDGYDLRFQISDLRALGNWRRATHLPTTLGVI
jgi:hypothetical protein